MKMNKPRTAWLLAALVVVPAAALAAPAAKETKQPPAQQQPMQKKEKGIDPEADRILKQMTDYVAGLQSFKVQSDSVDEVVLKDGQKIQFPAQSEISVQRPNRLKSERLNGDLSFIYDGKQMSLYCKVNNTYTTSPAPATLDATIDAARKQYKVEAPGADFLYSNPYDVLTEQVKGGKLVGKETLDGVPVNHLAFTGQDVDWQVWIQDGAQPLPLRFVVTTKTMKSQPQFTAQWSHWEPAAKLDAATFDFKPPDGATRVDTLPGSCGGKGPAGGAQAPSKAPQQPAKPPSE